MARCINIPDNLESVLFLCEIPACLNDIFMLKWPGKVEKYQYIDGVNNLDYWTGKSAEFERNHIFHYYESKLTAVRMGPWKFHFSTKEDYYANLIPRTVPLVFNVRMDPFESFDNTDFYGHLLQKVSWLIQPMGNIQQPFFTFLPIHPWNRILPTMSASPTKVAG
jgi:hypothetical protein